MNPDMLVVTSAGLVSMLINQLAPALKRQHNYSYLRDLYILLPDWQALFWKKNHDCDQWNLLLTNGHWMWLPVAMQQE